MLKVAENIKYGQEKGHKIEAIIGFSGGYIDLETSTGEALTSWSLDEFAQYEMYKGRNLLNEVIKTLVECNVEITWAE